MAEIVDKPPAKPVNAAPLVSPVPPVPPVPPVAREGETPPDGAAAAPREIGGPKGPEPTRYGDWERKGRCVDF